MPTCPVCHGQYAEAELLGPDGKKIAAIETPDTLRGKVRLCPRCETDIYSWKPQKPQQVDIRPLAERPYPLIVPLLSIVQGALTGWQPHPIGVILAVILSAIVFFSLANHAKTFRISKWARPFNDNPGLSIEMVELGSFLIGLGLVLVAIALMVYWTWPPAEPSFAEKLLTSLVYSLASTCLTLAFTLMLVNGQVRDLDRIMPQPVFTNTDRLLGIVLESVRKQLNLKETPQVENIQRTKDAGIQIIVGLKQPLEKSDKEGVVHWKIKADKWGRIRSIDVSDWWSFVET